METLDVQGKIEEAFRRILQPYIDSGDLSTMQLILRFFTGSPKSRRISVVVDACECSFRDEDGAPLQWKAEVKIEVTTNHKDDGQLHDEIVAITAEATYGGNAFCTELNTAMTGEGFNALFWESDVRRQSSKDGTACKTVISGNIEVQPW